MKYPPKKGGKWGGKQISKGFQQQHLGDDAGARASPAAAPAPTARPRPLVPQRGRGFLGLSLLPFFGEKKHHLGEGWSLPVLSAQNIPGGARSIAARIFLPPSTRDRRGIEGSHPASPDPGGGCGGTGREEKGGFSARRTARFISKWDRDRSRTRRSQI